MSSRCAGRFQPQNRGVSATRTMRDPRPKMFDLTPDQELWAARVRLHFEPRLRDTAEKLARGFVVGAGPRLRQLRPHTPLREVLGWCREGDSGWSSLDEVETVMAIEEEAGIEIADSFAEHFHDHTFRELVLHVHGPRWFRG